VADRQRDLCATLWLARHPTPKNLCVGGRSGAPQIFILTINTYRSGKIFVQTMDPY
jgi:hypothetical protein